MIQSDQALAMQFGLFGIFDGHGGVGAAKSASEYVISFLS